MTADVAPGPVVMGGLALAIVLVVAVGIFGVVVLVRWRKKK